VPFETFPPSAVSAANCLAIDSARALGLPSRSFAGASGSGFAGGASGSGFAGGASGSGFGAGASGFAVGPSGFAVGASGRGGGGGGASGLAAGTSGLGAGASGFAAGTSDLGAGPSDFAAGASVVGLRLTPFIPTMCCRKRTSPSSRSCAPTRFIAFVTESCGSLYSSLAK